MRLSFFALSLLLALLSAGCASPDAEPFRIAAETPAASATVSPSPLPPPRVLLVGAEAAPALADAFEAGAAQAGYAVSRLHGGVEKLTESATHRMDGMLLILSDEAPEPFPTPACPLLVCSLSGASVPEDIPCVFYDGASSMRLAIDAAAGYEPHVAPVRMLGMLTSEESDAFAAWKDAQKEGVVFNRGTYIASDNGSVAQFIEKQMNALYPGQLDCILAETGALACEAADALLAANRTDAEIFSAGSDSGVLNRMREADAPIVCAVGVNEGEAARVCLRAMEALLTGTAPANVKLGPAVFRLSATDAR